MILNNLFHVNWCIANVLTISATLIVSFIVYFIGKLLKDEMISNFGKALFPLALSTIFVTLYRLHTLGVLDLPYHTLFTFTFFKSSFLIGSENILMFLRLFTFNLFGILMLVAAFNGNMKYPFTIKTIKTLPEVIRKEGFMEGFRTTFFSTPALLTIYALINSFVGAFTINIHISSVTLPALLLTAFATVYAGIARINIARHYPERGSLTTSVKYAILCVAMAFVLGTRAFIQTDTIPLFIPLSFVVIITLMNYYLLVMAIERKNIITERRYKVIDKL